MTPDSVALNAYPSARYRVGVDIGGTFTDLIVLEDTTGVMTLGKRLTTPREPSQAVEQLLRETLARAGATPDQVSRIIHGTTLVTNAIIERKGARTALLTTRGFRDAYEIGREHRYELYDLLLEMPAPLVPRHLRLEVNERLFADGTVDEPLDTAGVTRIVQELSDKGIEAVAVCLLHSYVNPTHEQMVRQIVTEIAPDMRVSCSSDIDPEIREYERTSTTVANVYVQGLVDAYLNDLQQRLAALGFEGQLVVMLSSGGIATVDTAKAYPIRLLESGPAAGALATAYYGEQIGIADLLAFDMGGTTAKLCLVEHGQPRTATEFEVDRKYRFKKGSGLPIKVPVIELIEIGSGGGSIAHIDALGLLKVGPESAGSEPGPACYGRGGTLPTVTDADLVLGYLNPGYFLGGAMKLDQAAAEESIRHRIAEPLGLSVLEAAWGIHQIVNENMANAARVHVIERGRDPRSFPLFAFGGAGPVHAFGVAQILHAPRLIAPFGAGVTSSVGFLTAPLAFDFARSFYGLLRQLTWEDVNTLYQSLEAQGLQLMQESGLHPATVKLRREADVRYAGQGHEIRVRIPEGRLDAQSIDEIQASFENAYRSLYGRTGPDVDLEIMTWRLTVSGPRPDVRLTAGGDTSAHAAVSGERLVYFPEWGEQRLTPVYNRYGLAPGAEFPGPAIVEERESTVVIGLGARVQVDELSNLRVELLP